MYECGLLGEYAWIVTAKRNRLIGVILKECLPPVPEMLSSSPERKIDTKNAKQKSNNNGNLPLQCLLRKCWQNVNNNVYII
jgi:hypothetical protein